MTPGESFLAGFLSGGLTVLLILAVMEWAR